MKILIFPNGRWVPLDRGITAMWSMPMPRCPRFPCRLLILKPTYKSGWTIPGGVMEADGETPWEACRREVREECGLDVRGGRLACVDFRPARPGRLGGVRFLFDCGPAEQAAIDAITVQPEEIAEHRLVHLDIALGLLRPPIRRRVRAATRRRRCVYLENGRPVAGIA
jgi:8-oxo-dGTP diphosphatase